MNLVTNDGPAWLYIIPRAAKSEKAAVIDRWNYPVNRYELHNDTFLKLTFNKELHVRQSTEGSQCTDLDEESYYEVQLNISNMIHAFSSPCFLQCMGEVITARYTDFPKKSCPNVLSPCWIPQADSIIHEHIIRALPQCDTIEKYSCMLETIRGAVYKNVDKQCLKTCKAESSKTSSMENILNAFNAVSYNLSNKI